MVCEHGGRRPLGNLAPCVHHDAAVAERSNGVHHMLDNNDGKPFLPQHLHQGDGDLQLGRIKASQPFVEQQKIGDSASARASSSCFWSI